MHPAKWSSVTLLYANNMTQSLAKAIPETKRRRVIHQAYIEKKGIDPIAASNKVSNPILSFLQLSRKLEQDVPDSDLVEVSGDQGFGDRS